MGNNIILYIIAGIIFTADAILIIVLFSSRALNRAKTARYQNKKKRVIEAIASPDAPVDFTGLKIGPATLFAIYRDISGSISFPDGTMRNFIDYFTRTGIVRKYCEKTRSRSRLRRAEASIDLGFLPCDASRRALETALVREKHYYIKVYIINSLLDTGDEASIPYILQTLIGSPRWYREKIYGVMGQFGEKLYNYLINLTEIDSKELKMVIVSFANHYFSPGLTGLLIEFMDSGDPDISDPASDAFLKYYPDYLRSDVFIKSPNLHVKKNAVAAAGLSLSPGSIEILLNAMHDSSIFNDCVAAVSRITMKDSRLFQEVISRFMAEKDPVIKTGLAAVLSNRIEYFLARLRFDSSEKLKNMIVEVISRGSVNGAISFLNDNSDRELEDRICGTLGPLLGQRNDIGREFRLYLDERILEKFHLAKLDPQKGDPRQEAVRIDLLFVFLGIALLSFPAAYLISYYETFTRYSVIDTLKNMFYLFNYYFAYYAISLNSVYMLLLVFSLLSSRRQLRRWKMKNGKFLFKPGILPSISIIAPAYREEATIIESVNSLLNLNYPDHEVIVVNDGSTDRTLQVLIDYFDLERTNIEIAEKLRTSPLRGIYQNRHIPNLLVVDKVNGGKADSLNAGINIATRDYFCGIDADSLLERDSLLKMAAPFLDTDKEIIATGGNIVPVNGCTVDKGHLTSIEIPKNFLSRLQTMEYIRSFIAGRVGWAALRCLLIISGAFGLFRKSSVISSGGYLTGKEKYQKDTVGEDMELVVRLLRHSMRRGERVQVNYIFNANCWTEVPEDYGVLRRQRDRWQRGLLDIITFHIGMLFNPKYREVGLIAFPYFIIFEVIGPWIEAQGLLMFAMALGLGLLNTEVLLLLFIGTILMGVTVSIVSFYIMKSGNDNFSNKDIAILIFYAFIENFGIRHFFSVSRLGGYINALRNKQGWGTMIRKGFQSRPGT